MHAYVMTPAGYLTYRLLILPFLWVNSCEDDPKPTSMSVMLSIAVTGDNVDVIKQNHHFYL